MRILWTHLRRHLGLVALALGLAAINQIFSMLDPLIFRHVIDQYTMKSASYSTGEFLRGVGLLLAAAAGVALISRIAKNFQDYFLNVITQRVGAAIYAEGVRHALDLPYAAFEDQRSGETLGRLSKARTDVERFVNIAVNLVFTTIIGFVFVMTYASTTHWSVAPVYFLTVVALGVISMKLGRKIKETQRRIVAETTALAGATTESLRNIELVKSLGLANQETNRLNASTQRILALELNKVKTVRGLAFIQGTIVNTLRTSLLFLMLWLIFTKQISVGQFFALWIYSFFLFGPLQEFGTVINTWRETEASLENYEKLLKTPTEPRPEHPTPIGDLKELCFDHVRFQHASASRPALSDVSFTIRRGQTAAFVGPSGSGKTTLVKLLVGLYQPVEGRILYNGIAGTQVDIEGLRERLGLVTQDPQLFSGAIRDNLLFVRPGATDEECIAALKASAADSLLARADKGLDTLIGESGIKVSGGERQRLAIARALLRKPHLLVFDEATSALDSLTEEEVSRTIRDIGVRSNSITLMVAHRLSTVMHADRIYVLERGRIVEQGTHDELVDNKGLYYAMWRQQVGEGSAVSAF